MRCEDARERLLVWSDECADDAQLRAHTAGCRHCAAAQAQVLRLSSALTEAIRYDPPAALTALLLAHARAASAQLRPAVRPFWVELAFAAAAAAAAVAILFWPAAFDELLSSLGFEGRLVDAAYLVATTPAASVAWDWLETLGREAVLLALACGAWLYLTGLWREPRGDER